MKGADIFMKKFVMLFLVIFPLTPFASDTDLDKILDCGKPLNDCLALSILKLQQQIGAQETTNQTQQQQIQALEKINAKLQQQIGVLETKLVTLYYYQDNGNGTVTDNRTGLIWLKNANCFDRLNWETARQNAAKLADGQCRLSDGSKAGDWRLPSKKELLTIIDRKYQYPTLSNATGTSKWKENDAFSGVKSSYYWSSTSYKTSGIWGVYFDEGKVDYYDKMFEHYVWPVRGKH